MSRRHWLRARNLCRIAASKIIDQRIVVRLPPA
jgi:hypothetical protein